MTDDTVNLDEAAAKLARRKAYMAEWRAKNRAHIKAYMDDWHAAHPFSEKALTSDEIAKKRAYNKAWMANWHRTNQEKSKALTKARYKANSAPWKKAAAKRRREKPQEIAKYMRAYRIANLDRIDARIRDWMAKNPERVKAMHANRRTRELEAEGTFTAADVTFLFARQRGRCAYCRIPIKRAYHVDHITPLSKGGTNWPKNLQLTCGPCNRRKHAKDPIAFAQELGRLV